MTELTDFQRELYTMELRSAEMRAAFYRKLLAPKKYIVDPNKITPEELDALTQERTVGKLIPMPKGVFEIVTEDDGHVMTSEIDTEEKTITIKSYS